MCVCVCVCGCGCGCGCLFVCMCVYRVNPELGRHSHELQIDLSTPAAFYFRLVLRTSCIVGAPRPSRTPPLPYFPVYALCRISHFCSAERFSAAVLAVLDKY